MRPIFCTIILSLGFAATSLSCKHDTRSSDHPGPVNKASQSAPQDITICQFAKVFVYMPLYVAVEKGFFSQEGLNVKLINGGGDDKTFAAVASGQAQFGVADPTFAAIAREKGQPGLVVASVVAGAPFWGVTKKDSIGTISNAAQLKNLRIATGEGPALPAPTRAIAIAGVMPTGRPNRRRTIDVPNEA